MTRSDLVEELAARFSQLTHRDAEFAVKTLLDAVGEALVRGHRIEVRGASVRSLATELAGFGGWVTVESPQDLRDLLVTIGEDLVRTHRQT